MFLVNTSNKNWVLKHLFENDKWMRDVGACFASICSCAEEDVAKGI